MSPPTGSVHVIFRSPPNVDVAFGTTIRTSALREEVTCTATLVSLRAHPRASDLIVLTASVHLKIMSEAVLYTNSAQLASSPFEHEVLSLPTTAVRFVSDENISYG